MKHALAIAIAAAASLAAPVSAQGASAGPVPGASPLAASSGEASPAPLLPEDPSALLGMGLDEAWMAFGAPSRVYPLRGDEEWQDDVVFEYAQGFSLFWFGDRLWQIGFSSGYRGKVLGIVPGGAEASLSALGKPIARTDGFLVYELPYRGFPLRLRARVAAGRIEEAYVYRADF